jgi:hypothetical protein
MKQILKLAIGISLILSLLISCSVQESIEDVPNKKMSVRYISVAELRQNKKAAQELDRIETKAKLSANSRLTYDNNYQFYIDYDKILYIEQDGNHSYTMPIYREGESGKVENLVLNFKNQEEFTSYIFKYMLTDEDLEFLKYGIDIIDLEDKTEIEVLRKVEWIICDVIANVTRVESYSDIDGQLEFSEFVTTYTYIFCPSSGGGGGAGSGDSSNSGNGPGNGDGSSSGPGSSDGSNGDPGSSDGSGTTGGGGTIGGQNPGPTSTDPKVITTPVGWDASLMIRDFVKTFNPEQQDWWDHDADNYIKGEIKNYLDNNYFTDDSKQFIYWAIAYLNEHPEISFNQFVNQFMGITEGTDQDFNQDFWDNPNLVFPQQDLPSWDAFNDAYPKNTAQDFEMGAPSVYYLVGGNVKAMKDGVLNDTNPNNDHDYDNACALRVSRALNYSGVTIPHIFGKTFKGADNKYYFLGAANLFNWMIKTFPLSTNTTYQVDGENAGPNGSFLPLLLDNNDNPNDDSNHGIYLMLPINPGPNAFGASGHAGIYTTPALTHYYFNATGGIKLATLWILN